MAIDYVAQHYHGGDWEPVLKMNIHGFMFKLKFLGFKTKKEASHKKAQRTHVRR